MGDCTRDRVGGAHASAPGPDSGPGKVVGGPDVHRADDRGGGGGGREHEVRPHDPGPGSDRLQQHGQPEAEVGAQVSLLFPFSCLIIKVFKSL